MWVGIGVGIGRNRFATGIFNAYALRVTADGGITEAGQCVDAVTGILLNASLLLIPSGYKGGKLYSEIPTNGNGDLTWTRGSDAFRTNASGLIQRVPWNLAQYSEQFDNGIWNKTNSSVTANTTTSPDGTSTADKLIVNNAASIAGAYIQQAITKSAVSTTYSYTCYAKASELDAIRVYVRDSISAANFAQVYYNINDGSVITAATSGGTFSAASSTITSVANGFYRINLTFTSSADTQLQLRIYPYDTVKTTGNGTDGISIWGAQLVEGTTAQTYLPTTDRLNFPRLSYMYGSCPSALLEPQRTNLLLQSETFDSATWVKDNSSVTANTTTSPDGSSNADTYTGNGSLSAKFTYQTNTITSGTTYSISIYAKKNTNNFIQIVGATASFGLNAWANFDLNNGTVGSVGSAATASIVNVGNGWYRCVIVAPAVATGTFASALYTLIVSSTSARLELNSLSTSVFIYGAQLEAGAYPTTYIPTTSATATRVADSFSRNNIYTNGLISAIGGTWFVELRNNIGYTRDAAAFGLFIDSASGGITNGFSIRQRGTAGDRLSIQKQVAGTQTFLYLTTANTTKLAIKWNGTTADIFENGTKVVSATSFTPTAMEFLNASIADVPFFIQQMALFPTPLTDAQCQTLTT